MIEKESNQVIDLSKHKRNQSGVERNRKNFLGFTTSLCDWFKRTLVNQSDAETNYDSAARVDFTRAWLWLCASDVSFIDWLCCLRLIGNCGCFSNVRHSLKTALLVHAPNCSICNCCTYSSV